jgi:hypothetical protein
LRRFRGPLVFMLEAIWKHNFGFRRCLPPCIFLFAEMA